MLRRTVSEKRIYPAPRRLMAAAVMLWAALMASVVHGETTYAAEETDRDALVALYHATDGDNWYRNDNWLTDAPLDTWYGVTTDRRGEVIKLELSENGLKGSIPSELGRLTGLEWLDLSENELSGGIPPELGNLTNLTGLSLWSNRLNGGIPSELGNLTNLTGLSLGGNRLSGGIPPELGNLTDLTGLSLWGNRLSGKIPSELGKLTNLEMMFLGGNNLGGEIPPELGRLTNLEYLGLERNRLSGEIPSEMGRLTNLEYLDLERNRLSGEIPSELGNLTNLEEFYLSENRLEGCVPEGWRDVEENDLVGLDMSFCVAQSTTATQTQEPLDSSKVFARISPAIVFIATEIGTGSGVLVEGGYLVTNAHVVWPFRQARVVFPDGTVFEKVTVVGWDLLADLAVLGPVNSITKPLELTDGEGTPIGSDVYLIGYPGEYESLPQPAIGRGLLSRLREWESAGITYFQTDAVAIGGQSGGVLVSQTAEVIGISGFSITEGNFGLVASAADLLPRIRQLIAGEDSSGLGERLLLEGRGAHRHEMDLENYWDDRAYLIYEPVRTEVVVELAGGADGQLLAFDTFGGKILDLDEEFIAPEVGSFVTNRRGPHFLVIRQLAESPSEFTVRATHQLTKLFDPDNGQRIRLGQTVGGNMDFPGDTDHFRLHLERDETIEIVTRSALVDTLLTIDYLGATSEQIVQNDNSGGGLFGRDSRVVYRAPRTGTYFVVVRDANWSAPGGYTVSVNSAGPNADSSQSSTKEFGQAELRSALSELLASYLEVDPELLDIGLEDMEGFLTEDFSENLVVYILHNSNELQAVMAASGQIDQTDLETFDIDLSNMAQRLSYQSRRGRGGSNSDRIDFLEMSPVGDASLGFFSVDVSAGGVRRTEMIFFRRGNLGAFIISMGPHELQMTGLTEQAARAVDAEMIAYLTDNSSGASQSPVVTVNSGVPKNVRSGPGTDYSIVGAARVGQQFLVTGRNPAGDWWQIDYEGQNGWIYAPLVTASNAEDVRVVSTSGSSSTSEAQWGVEDYAYALIIMDQRAIGNEREWNANSQSYKDASILLVAELLDASASYCDMSFADMANLVDEKGALLDNVGYTTRNDFRARSVLMLALLGYSESYPFRQESCETLLDVAVVHLLAEERK